MAQVWCFLIVVFWEVILVCIMLETVRIPRVVAINPDTAALKAVLVSVRMLAVSSARKLAVSIMRFVRVIKSSAPLNTIAT